MRSARRSVSVPCNKNSTTTSTTINEDNKEENENRNKDNEGNSNNAMKRTDLEKETIANVSAMLDMSANEVEEVLGMSFANNPVDVITVFEVLHGLIVEHAKVEGALIKIHQQFVLKRTESKIKKAENRLAQQINHEQQGIGKRTTVTNKKE